MIHNINLHYLIRLNSVLDWLWQDYILYDYYKTQFMDRVKAFGRPELDVEKEMLQKVSLQAMNECSISRKKSSGYFCNYYKKGELNFLDEVREIQRNKSLEILRSIKDTVV